jgi:predicted RNA-binding Zn-ribbon protein involved in translation (DUF1610 family)
MMDSVHTFAKYGNDFALKHEEELGPAAATAGGLITGFMRAILECDNCGPGVFRIPKDENWYTLHCPNCGGVWVMKEEAR